MNKRLQKYLRTRAANSPWVIEGMAQRTFCATIVIPALAEVEVLPATLKSLAFNPPDEASQTLFLVVVNNRSDASSEQKDNNLQTLRWLKNRPFPKLNLAWVDACSAGLELPVGEGVGLARKIGFDLSLPALDWNSAPFFISLDADTLVDPFYLPALFQHFKIHKKAGAVLPFRHQQGASQEQEKAIRQYELYLRVYLFGLQLAGSPYAYHTIGSAFACQAAAYLAAGGMNRRQAAEDFYFLQQLSKVGGLEKLQGTVVRPSPRFSDRVPFGTGKTVQAQVEDSQILYSFVSARSFQLLKSWLELINHSVTSSAEIVLQQAEMLSPTLRQFLEQLNFTQVWERLQQNHTLEPQRLRAFHYWFDALRTRQLLTSIEADWNSSSEPLVSELLSWGGYSGKIQEKQQLLLLESLQGVR